MRPQEAPAKIVMGGKPNNAIPLPPCRKRDPPPPHGKNGLHVDRKDCPHRKNIPIGEIPPPPGERLLFPPLRAKIMISTHFIPFV